MKYNLENVWNTVSESVLEPALESLLEDCVIIEEQNMLDNIVIRDRYFAIDCVMLSVIVPAPTIVMDIVRSAISDYI